MNRARGRRGSFLMQAVVMVAILGLIVTGLIKMSMGRHVMSYRLTSSQQTRQLAKGLEARALSCLQGSGAGETSCAAAGGVNGCFAQAQNAFRAATGRNARIQFSGTFPSCTLAIEVDD
jgi:hypothetical protein